MHVRSQFKLRTLLAAVTAAALLLALTQHLAVSFSYDPDRSQEFHLYVAWARKGDLNEQRFVFLEVAHNRLARNSSGWNWLILQRANAAAARPAAALASR
jgi:hypothetical protein